VPRLPLSGSDYVLAPYIEVSGTTEDFLMTGASLSVEDDEFFGQGKLYPPGWQGKGVLVAHDWSLSDAVLESREWSKVQ
jgi:lipopolysaccharide transport system ATP-binding protein